MGPKAVTKDTVIIMPDLLDELEKIDVDPKRGVLDNNKNDKEETIFAVSFCLIPSFNQTLKELKEMIEYKSLMNASSLYLSCNGNIINEDDEKKEILHKNRATIVCIGWPQGIIDERPGTIRRVLYRIIKEFGCGECSVITKTDETIDVRVYREDELSREEWNQIRKIGKPFKKYLEELKDKKQSNKLQKIDIENDILQFRTIYRCGGLMMRNVDSDVEIDDECLEYVALLIDVWLSSDSSMPLSKDNAFRLLAYSGKKPDLPILLKKKLPEYSSFWKEIDDERRNQYIPHGEVLGYYSRDEHPLCMGPHIVLCPENIRQIAQAYHIPFKILMAKVLVHEIAHALMDRYQIIDGNEIQYTNPKENLSNTVEAKAMEESMANAITLFVFRKYANEDYKYVRHYIDNMQSAIYKFGLWQEQIYADWNKWRDSSKQNTKELKEWFNKCFDNGDIIITKEDYKQKLFNNVF